MSEAKVDLERERAREWQRAEVKRRLEEVDAGLPGHREVTEKEVDAAVDLALAEPKLREQPTS